MLQYAVLHQKPIPCGTQPFGEGEERNPLDLRTFGDVEWNTKDRIHQKTNID